MSQAILIDSIDEQELSSNLVILDLFNRVQHDNTIRFAQKRFSLFEVTKLIRLT